jgi:hypothetical protein
MIIKQIIHFSKIWQSYRSENDSNKSKLSKIWGSHGGECVDGCLLGCSVEVRTDVWNDGKLVPTYTAIQPSRQQSSNQNYIREEVRSRVNWGSDCYHSFRIVSSLPGPKTPKLCTIYRTVTWPLVRYVSIRSFICRPSNEHTWKPTCRGEYLDPREWNWKKYGRKIHN